MPKKELSAWMLEEHTTTRELSDELRAKVTSRPGGDRVRWIEELRTIFDKYAAHVRRHAPLEEEGGYLKQVLELRPTLTEAVDIIKHEHEELVTILADVQTAVHELAPTDNFLLRDCCKRVRHLLTWMERHQEHENHIVLYAFTQDIGTSE